MGVGRYPTGPGILVGVAGKSKDTLPPTPRAPGWYPDPFSATGTGERYWDGKTWGTSEQPLGRPTTSLTSVRRKKKLRRGLSSSTSVFLVVVLAIGALYIVPKLQDDSAENGQKNEQLPRRPPKSTEEAKEPLGLPAAVPSEGGKFEVIGTQPDNTELPVAWDPCRPIHYVVNTANAPVDGAPMIRAAIKQVSVASGLQFVYDGTTREQLSKNREAYLPTRYGADRWAPVLIGWSNETAYPDLAGYIDGEAGPTWVDTPDGAHLVSVSGQVALDAEDLSIAKVPNRAEALAVILHELGHLVGLAHTNDPTQLMYSENKFNTLTYQAGDLNGLSELGTQPCYPDV